MATSGQTLNDRINAARYALAGQGLARCVCKATTEEVIGPKKKHLDYLLACTHEPNVSIPQLANLLIERTNHIYWVVVFKALVTVHHLMSYGNERFTQYLASSNYSFELSTFLDKTAARDFSMSTFIRRYSRYINEKALSYRLLAFDFCKVKRGNEGVLRLMPIDRLLKTLPILQCQLDALLEFDCSANDLNNGVINAAFMLLFRDLIGLFACHNDGIINLLNKYFNLNRKMTREALDLYKKFLVRMDKVSDFLRVAEVVGIDKDEIPDLRRAPSSLIDALEQHLQNMESNKKILKQPNLGNNNNNKSNEFSALGNLTPPSSRRPNSPALGGNPPSSNQQNDDFALNTFRDEEVRKALEEEARVLSQYGTDGMKSKPTSKGGGTGVVVASMNNNSPEFAFATIPKSVDDIFGDADSFGNSNLDSNGSALDNLSSASSSSSTANKLRPDLDSIKSAIKSATTTLEKTKGSAEQRSSITTNNNNNNKKASDDLFSLLDTTSSPASVPATQPAAAAAAAQTGAAKNAMTLIGPPPSSAQTGRSSHRNAPLEGDNPISPFATPFDLPQTSNISNGQMPTLKPGNPFPDAADHFATGPSSAFPMALKATLTTNPSQAAPASSIFRSGTSTANYTNLGRLLNLHFKLTLPDPFSLYNDNLTNDLPHTYLTQADSKVLATCCSR